MVSLAAEADVEAQAQPEATGGMDHVIDEEKPVECIGCGQESGLERCTRCKFYYCADCLAGAVEGMDVCRGFRE